MVESWNCYDNANWLSKLTFFWARHYIYSSPNRDVPPDMFNTEPNLSRLKAIWEYEKTRPNPSFFRSLFSAFSWLIIKSQLGFVIDIFSQVAFGIFIGLLIEFIQDENENANVGFAYAVALVVCVAVSLFARQISFFQGQLCSGIVKQSVLNLIYSKTLKLSHEVLHSGGSIGKVMNIASGDVESFEMISLLNFIWLAPIAAITVSVALFLVIGPVGLIGLGVIICFAPLQTLVNYMNYRIKSISSSHGDLRLRRTNDVVEGIRVLKMYGWEQVYAKKINSTRSDEVSINRWRMAIRSSNMSFCLVTEGIASLATFSSYIAIYGNISSSVIFSTLSLMVTAQFYLTLILPFASELVFSYLASCERIRTFLMEPEHVPIFQETIEGRIKLDKVTAFWKPPKLGVIELNEFHLNNVSVEANPGELVVVIGSVGSGKSSLLMSMLGEMHVKQGQVYRGGKIAYVEQEPWIFSGTFQENIILDKEFDEEKYLIAVNNSALRDDLEKLPIGDKTMIGEKGNNISGGQKARLALARAIYSDADIYLLDDPLSAVDSKVAKFIFENAIIGCLSNKTRVLVTHQLHFVKPGMKVFKVENGNVYTLHSSEPNLELLSPSESSEEITVISPQENEEPDEEDINIGFKVYLRYFLKGWGWSLPLLILLYPACMLAYISVPYWLVHWSSQSSKAQHDSYYVGVLGLLIVLVISLALLRNNLMSQTLLTSSRNIHNEVLERIVKCPITFYDQNPSGKIIGRLSNDISKLDDMIPWMFTDFMQGLFITVGSVLIMVIGNPWIGLLLLPMIFLLKKIFVTAIYPCHRFYNQLNSSKTPLLNHFSITLYGLFSIRCYDLKSSFIDKFKTYNQVVCRNFFCYHSSMRWMHFNSDAVCAIFITINIFLSVIMINYLDRKLVSTGLSLVLVLAMDLVWAMFQFSQVQTYMASADRMLEFSRLAIENYSNEKELGKISRGEIIFDQVCLSYSGTYALNQMSFTIRGGDKVGIVGRTGAGKSSIIQALFRITEIDSGKIYIDGVDISRVSLTSLRNAIGVIPQSPFIFTASVRYNLDPFGIYTDEEIWSALNTAHLSQKIVVMPGKLDENLNSSSFSAGEKQLLCLARALLKKCKILVMDEATANVDFETDRDIGIAINSHFNFCTVLTIAHRLETVIKSNVIIVVDSGKCIEIGSPENLLKDSKSEFFALVENTGEKAENLLQLALLASQSPTKKLI